MLTGFIRRAARALTPNGREDLDQTPVAIPAGFKRPPSLEEQIRRLIQQPEFGKVASGDQDAESFDEANDFDIPDDPADPNSIDEEYQDPVLGTVTAREAVEKRDKLLRATEERIAARLSRASKKAPKAEEPPPAPSAPKAPAQD